MVLTRENLFLLGLGFLQRGETAFEDLPPLLDRLFRDVLRRGFLSGLGQIDHRFGLSDNSVFIRFQIFTCRAERFDEQGFRFGVELRQEASVRRSRQGFQFTHLRPESIRSSHGTEG